MAIDRRAAVLRILDDQNRLVERADSKAISLLTTVGLFSAFFIAQFRSLPITPFSIALIVVYFVAILLTIMHVILAISPRIRASTSGGQSQTTDEKKAYQPTFYAGIVSFPNSTAYRKVLDAMLDDEAATTNTYIDQVYSVAKINDAKYKYVQRAVVLAVITIVVQLALIAYAFADMTRTAP